MKKYIAGIVALVMLSAFMFAGASTAEAKRINVVTTIFPVYDWVREIVGDNDDVEITMLLDDGVDLHSYQPTAQDIMKVATCDVFVYVGGESDEWVGDALAESVNNDMVVVNLVEAMGEDIKLEERVEGMEHEHEDEEHGDEAHEDEEHEDEEHGDEEHEDGEHGHEHEDEVDEHVWLSLRNARKLVKALAVALGEADPANAGRYTANADAYAEKLAALDAEYTAAREAAEFDTVLFGDRFPFRYLVDDYNLNYYAAFSGCSAESEASFETIVFLAGKVDALGLTTVLTIEGDNHRIAETIVGNTQAKDAKVLAMDSLQGTTGEDVKNGATYLGVMEANLEVLKQALVR
ncbi:MAG: zinc ABC transporter substrate-binding protein [Clostridia bacterium]|nr:zinc ABC transporter substrate-binding protein [Clostridia bacterium]